MARDTQVSKIIAASRARESANKEQGTDSPEYKRALATQHAACRNSTDEEVREALRHIWDLDC